MDGWRRKRFVVVAMAVTVAVMWLGLANAQEEPGANGNQQVGQQAGQPGRQGRGQGGGNGRFDPQQMQQRMLERFKELLQPSDQEWQALKPRIEKVMTLSRQTGGTRMMMGNRGGARSTNAAQVSAAEKAAGELQTALDNKNAKSGEISAKLTALRAAKKKAGKDLTDAQIALGELLTPRQEAQLVLMGLLE